MKKAAKRGKTAMRLIAVLLLLGAGLYLASRIAFPLAELPQRAGPALADAQTWGYQLQKVKPGRIPAGLDLLVVDYSRDGSDRKAFSRRDVERLRRRPDGSKRIVLAYLSIGEAENYRYYWWPFWRFIGPGWLGQENSEWRGNYPVRYWQHGWQSIILRPARTGFDALGDWLLPWRKPYIDRILEAGFDGVYLDRVDVFSEWEGSRKSAARDMVRFVAVLSAYAKSRKLGFLIVPQNGEELLAIKNYRLVIDGVAKEDLYYGINDDGEKNSKTEVRRSLGYLRRAQKDALPVFVVEYLTGSSKRRRARRLAGEKQLRMTFARRELDRPPARPFVSSPRASIDAGGPTDLPAKGDPSSESAETPDRPAVVAPIRRQAPRDLLPNQVKP